MWYESAFWNWTIIIALLIGGLVHVYPKLLSKLTKLPILNAQNVRIIQFLAGAIIIIHAILMIWY